MAEDKLNRILEAVVHIKDKLDNEMVTKTEFAEFRSENTAHIDGFIKLHQTLDQELVSLRRKYERLEDRLKTVEGKVGIKPA